MRLLHARGEAGQAEEGGEELGITKRSQLAPLAPGLKSSMVLILQPKRQPLAEVEGDLGEVNRGTYA